MRGVFEDGEAEELELPQRTRDAEFTLGSGTLLLIFFGLVLVCGICFGLGYAVGHHGAQPPSVAGQLPAIGAPTPVQASGSVPKPSATSQPAASQSVPSTPSDNPQPGAASQPQSSAPTPTPALPPQAPAPAGSTPTPSQVRPALPSPANSPQTASASHAMPAVPPANPLMVQIAAVSHQEDADVLVGALRKRGYAVSARRDPADSLIHVRIGPFNNHDEAERWRLKLLNDGYNAMIQP